MVDEGEPMRQAEKSGIALASYTDAPAYVLIAEPGAGKTTAFKTEAASQGGTFVTVRNFLTFSDKPEWHDTTLFLDGLDESRAGMTDGRTPLDDVRKKLYGLGCPPFRLSCRWADWMAANDKEALREVSTDGAVIVIRLDPLSKKDIKAILANSHGVDDTDGFIKAARKRGVDRLLTNPQNLDLLAKSVSRGEWPDSRKGTFERACRMLACELNGEHLAANPSSADIGPLIQAAGRLCAAQLLSGTAGYTLPDRAQPDGDYPSFTDVYGDIKDATAWNVLGTRLFVGISQGKLAPAHRQIAEFLAAQYVSGLLDQGLPLERILALITGFDGELVPTFRNLASWLAIHNKRSRKRLSQLNPSGMIYVGDRGTYSVDEKRAIVRNLRRESTWNPWCNRSISKVSGIGGIVGPELEETFREILSDSERKTVHQSYVMLLMQMLADGEPLLGLSEELEQVIRDPTWIQGVRCAALDVLAAYCSRGRLRSNILKQMIVDIESGLLDDPQDELLGILLKALYPKVLSIAEVQRYLRKPKLVDRTGEYADFWTLHIPKESTPDQLAELLDGIVERFVEYRPFMVGDVGRNTWLNQLPIEIFELIMGKIRFRNFDKSVETARLYEWLGVVSDPGLAVPQRKRAGVKFDLEWNMDALKALIAHGVKKCVYKGEECHDLVDRRLFGARPRVGYGKWCLEMALTAETGTASSLYLGELLHCVIDGTHAGGLTMESARAGLAANELLLNEFNEIAERQASIESNGECRTATGSVRVTESVRDTEEQRAWRSRVAAQASALRAGRGSPRLLADVAEVYLGIHKDSTASTPGDRLRNLVGDRSDLIDLMLAGLEGSIRRDDLPSCDEVIRLFDQQRVDWLVLSFAAGVHSLEQSGRLSVCDLNQNQIRMALTILYTLPRKCVDPDHAGQNGLYRPKWFQALLRDDPAMVAEVLRGTVLRKIETGIQLATELREVADADDHREVAESVSLSLLEHFPKAETDATLLGLCWSLKAALKRCDWSPVCSVIEGRLVRGGLGGRERGCWLAAGYLLAPERFREDVLSLSDDCPGLKSLAMFVSAGRFPKEFTRNLSPLDFVPIVTALGAALRREGLTKEAYWRVSDLIGTLAEDPGATATDALYELSELSEAKPWEPAIAGTKEQQALRRREHEFRHCDIGKVVHTLNNAAPANAGDLSALVFNEMTDISRKIRHGSTSDWRQYWNVDHHNRPIDPKPEDACRDAVLSDLQERIGRIGIDAQPEGVYAEDKRSDIRVGYEGFNVPVEIKRSCHGDLWTAVKSQLIAKYTRDPEASGYGIYFVFWFGYTEKCRPTKCGDWTPKTAEDVRVRIQQSLDDRERRLISVCVVDVSKPN